MAGPKLDPVNWGEQLAGNFVTLEGDKQKALSLQLPPGQRKVNKFGSEDFELVFNCVEEDGEPCQKQFTTLSKRLKAKLKPLVEQAMEEKKDLLHITVLKVGDKQDTQYSVKRVMK